MRLHRSRSRFTFRRQRRSMGCMSILVSSVLLVGASVVLWLWYGRLSNRTTPANPGGDGLAAAQTSFDQGDLEAVVLQARQYLAIHPDDVTALYILTRALIYRSYSEYNLASDREAPVSYTAIAAAHHPDDHDILAVHALALQAADQPAAAAEAAQKALESDAPSAAIARTALGLAYDSVGSFDLAVQQSERAVQTAASQPALVDALRAQAISYRDVGRYADALATVERAIGLDDRLLALKFEQAQYAQLLGNTDRATVAYFSILTQDSENVKARLRLCELSSLMRERERAVEYCQGVTVRAPSWYEGWYRLGMEYFLEGNFEQAQRNLHRCATLQILQAVATDELRFECWYIQGQAAEIRGDCQNLIAIYNEWRTIAADRDVEKRWTYPPEGPPGCSN